MAVVRDFLLQGDLQAALQRPADQQKAVQPVIITFQKFPDKLRLRFYFLIKVFLPEIRHNYGHIRKESLLLPKKAH